MIKFTITCLLTLLSVFIAAGCVSEDTAGEGSLTLEVSGGEALRTGFPYTENGITTAFVDGWQLQFTKYVIVIGDVVFSQQDDASEVERWAGPMVLDLAQSATGSETLCTANNLPARRLDLGFSLLAPTAQTVSVGVNADDIALMVQNGWSFLVAGKAVNLEKGRTVQFRIGLPISAVYSNCINGKDTTQGISIEAGKNIGAYIYAHAIHLFWDTLASGDEDLRFDAFAAMAGDDGLVTEEELKNQDLTDLRDENGDPLVDEAGNRVVYNDGGLLPPSEWTLYHFVKYAARASVHFNGVGLCVARDF
jgi:hypothetical protein